MVAATVLGGKSDRQQEIGKRRMERLLFSIDDGLHKLFRRNSLKDVGDSRSGDVSGKSFLIGKIKDRFGTGNQSGVVQQYVQDNVGINEGGHFECLRYLVMIRSMRRSSGSTSPMPDNIPTSASTGDVSSSSALRGAAASEGAALSISGVSASGVTVRRAFPAGISSGTSKSKWRRRSAGISTICSIVMEKI